MEHRMRRADRAMGEDEALALLERADYGVLATVDEDGTPYGVPIGCAFDAGSGCVFMHCSSAGGHKLENVASRPRASLTVVSDTELLPKQFTTRYSSAIARGDVRVARDAKEKRRGLELLLAHHAPQNVDAGMRYIDAAFDRVEVLVLEVESLSGKHRS